MKNIIIKVKGMECNGCENRVCNALKTLDSVKEVTASYKTGIVTIVANESIDTNTLIQKIEDIGFNVIKEG